MKTNQITIITITAVLLFTLSGCEEPKGYLELKEPLPEVEDLPKRKDWLTTPVTEHLGKETEATEK